MNLTRVESLAELFGPVGGYQFVLRMGLTQGFVR
jgi:hypothetical protein